MGCAAGNYRPFRAATAKRTHDRLFEMPPAPVLRKKPCPAGRCSPGQACPPVHQRLQDRFCSQNKPFCQGKPLTGLGRDDRVRRGGKQAAQKPLAVPLSVDIGRIEMPNPHVERGFDKPARRLRVRPADERTEATATQSDCRHDVRFSWPVADRAWPRRPQCAGPCHRNGDKRQWNKAKSRGAGPAFRSLSPIPGNAVKTARTQLQHSKGLDASLFRAAKDPRSAHAGLHHSSSSTSSR